MCYSGLSSVNTRRTRVTNFVSLFYYCAQNALVLRGFNPCSTELLLSIQQDTRTGLPQFLGWPEVLISFSLALSHSIPRHYASCRGLVLRARECVFPAKAAPIRSLVTGRLASGGNRTPRHHPTDLLSTKVQIL